MACGKCKHFEPRRNPETGRALTSKPGDCAYPIIWPAVPSAYKVNTWGGFKAEFPRPRPMWKEDGLHCATFAAANPSSRQLEIVPGDETPNVRAKRETPDDH
jgi:hypothetical protein